MIALRSAARYSVGMTTDPFADYYTVEQFASLHGVSTRLVQHWISSGRLTTVPTPWPDRHLIPRTATRPAGLPMGRPRKDKDLGPKAASEPSTAKGLRGSRKILAKRRKKVLRSGE